jgi:hypothetical protein
MQTDLYTKAVLTVIALALSAIAIQLTTKDAHAQSSGFRFTENGALMVSECHPNYIEGLVFCSPIKDAGKIIVKPKL